MKHSVFAVATLISIAFFSICTVKTVDQTVHRTIELVSFADRANSAEVALSKIEQAEEYWKQHEGFFGAVLRHDEIDDVIDTFALLKAYAEREDWDDYYGNCASLLARLEHIRAKERPLLQNIL